MRITTYILKHKQIKTTTRQKQMTTKNNDEKRLKKLQSISDTLDKGLDWENNDDFLGMEEAK